MKYVITVTIRDNYDETFKTVRDLEIDCDDYFTLKNFKMNDYDEVWDRLVDQLDGPDLPDDWYIDHIEYRGGMYR